MVANGLRGDNIFHNLGYNMRMGAVGGLSSGMANIAIMGGAIRPPEGIESTLSEQAAELGIKYDPVYRSGGLYGLGARIGLLRSGFAGFGRNLIVNATGHKRFDRGVFYEETIHYWKGMLNGWGDNIGRLTGEHFNHWVLGGPDPYKTVGNLEWEAQHMAYWMGGY